MAVAISSLIFLTLIRIGSVSVLDPFRLLPLVTSLVGWLRMALISITSPSFAVFVGGVEASLRNRLAEQEVWCLGAPVALVRLCTG